MLTITMDWFLQRGCNKRNNELNRYNRLFPEGLILTKDNILQCWNYNFDIDYFSRLYLNKRSKFEYYHKSILPYLRERNEYSKKDHYASRRFQYHCSLILGNLI